ncbi:MAG TPA: lysylphosphatidylglycerol synthase transmembrane domain-containing protein [Acidobacteriaceae bacterium]
MKMRSATLAALCLVLLLVGAWAAHRHPFDWHSLRLQLRSIAWLHVAIGIACIYIGFWFRAVRWAVLLGPRKRVASSTLVAPQFIGFTAVALFGRLADLTRPYLIARRTGLPIATQVAVYSVERIFDLAAAAILFSVTLAFAPRDLPHHEAFARAGIISLAATLGLAAFALTIRFAGDRIAQLATRLLNPLSPKFAALAAARILDFRTGLDTLTSVREFLATLALSLMLWLGIAEAYQQCAHAMAATPQLATLTFTQTMLLLAASMGGSLLQLPIVGWFTQIAVLAAALHAFFSAPVEAATACGAIILFVTTLSIVPVGLIAARLSGTTLRAASRQSEEYAVKT